MLETALIILIISSIIALAFRRAAFSPPKTAPSDERTYAAFERVESLFVNPSERAFFHAVHRALPRGYHLHSKVRLEDIIRVKPHTKGEARWRLRGRVKSRHVDYLITDGRGTPRLVIELDGSSHEKRTENADKLKDGVFKHAGLTLITVKTGEDFTAAANRVTARLRKKS